MDLASRRGSSTFAEKMSNPAFTSVVFTGDRKEVRSLYGKMERLQRREKPLVENGFYEASRWLGNLVTRLGGKWQDVYCRGTWDDLLLEKGSVSFFTETAWNPPYALLKFIGLCYPSLECFYFAEGDGWCLTNDAEGRFFTSRYIVDCEPDMDYFETVEEACSYLSSFIGEPIAPSWTALCQAAERWNDEHPDADWPVNTLSVEIVSDDDRDGF